MLNWCVFHHRVLLAIQKYLLKLIKENVPFPSHYIIYQNQGPPVHNKRQSSIRKPTIFIQASTNPLKHFQDVRENGELGQVQIRKLADRSPVICPSLRHTLCRIENRLTQISQLCNVWTAWPSSRILTSLMPKLDA